jgi:hypothetical protein
MEFTTWEDYKKRSSAEQPPDPGQMYEEYTNWVAVMGGRK